MPYSNTEKAAIIESLRNQYTRISVSHGFAIVLRDHSSKNFKHTKHDNSGILLEVWEQVSALINLQVKAVFVTICLLTYLIILFYIYCFLNCMTLNIFHDCWKRAIIVSLPKTGVEDSHVPFSFQPISLLFYFSKIYKGILVNLSSVIP